jgi:hypothetical protein
VLEALAAAIVDHGEPAPAACDVPPMVRVASVARWRDAADRYLPQQEPKRKGEAFNRAIASLVGSGRVRHVAGFAWMGDGRTGRTGSHEASVRPSRDHRGRVARVACVFRHATMRPRDRGPDCDVLVDLIRQQIARGDR